MDEVHGQEKNSAAPGLITQATQASTPTSRRIMFEINPNININSKALLDMISETEVSTPASENAANAPGPSKLVNLEEKISVAEAFDNW